MLSIPSQCTSQMLLKCEKREFFISCARRLPSSSFLIEGKFTENFTQLAIINYFRNL